MEKCLKKTIEPLYMRNLCKVMKLCLLVGCQNIFHIDTNEPCCTELLLSKTMMMVVPFPEEDLRNGYSSSNELLENCRT